MELLWLLFSMRQNLLKFTVKKKGSELYDLVRKLTDEANQIQIDWDNNSLHTAGQIVRAEMHLRYPHLGDKALDAIAWKFTFDWR